LFPITSISFAIVVVITRISFAFLAVIMFLSQACLLLRVLLVFFPVFIVTSIQIAIFFFVGGVSQAAARQSHECVFFCVVLRQFRQAIFLGLL